MSAPPHPLAALLSLAKPPCCEHSQDEHIQIKIGLVLSAPQASLDRLIWRPSLYSQILLLGVLPKSMWAGLAPLRTSSKNKCCSVGGMQVPGCVCEQGFIKNTVLPGEKLKSCKLYGKS